MEMAGVQMLPPDAGVAWTRRELVSNHYHGEVIAAGVLGMLAAEYDEQGGVDLTSLVDMPLATLPRWLESCFQTPGSSSGSR